MVFCFQKTDLERKLVKGTDGVGGGPAAVHNVKRESMDLNINFQL